MQLTRVSGTESCGHTADSGKLGIAKSSCHSFNAGDLATFPLFGDDDAENGPNGDEFGLVIEFQQNLHPFSKQTS
jgi:hypothetical protein